MQGYSQMIDYICGQCITIADIKKDMLQINDYAAFSKVATPFYYYDIDLFRATVAKVAELSDRTGIQVHYSVKANSDHRLNDIISAAGLGADCVRGDKIAIRSAGAYGQVIASRYNMRPFAPSVYSDRLEEAPRRKGYFIGE